ncbi:uncharacterized protein [Parasteatoda tepidariorum]|uniref:uncharacterized protein n=1 Tax=Parasteatoda tepidariorum TaxID=114398 RepID=UPI0039BC7022
MEKLPIEWEKGSICLIFKKGDQLECPKSLQVLANTDDIDIIGRSERDVKEAFRALEVAATSMSLAVHEGKTKFLEFSSSTVNYSAPLCINGYNFERVNEFKYLDSVVNDQNILRAEINNRVQMANGFF